MHNRARVPATGSDKLHASQTSGQLYALSLHEQCRTIPTDRAETPDLMVTGDGSASTDVSKLKRAPERS